MSDRIEGAENDFDHYFNATRRLSADNKRLLARIEALEQLVQAIEHEVAIVYDDITGGRISKCNTVAADVLAVAHDVMAEDYERRIEELEADIKERRAYLRTKANEWTVAHREQRERAEDAEARIEALTVAGDGLAYWAEQGCKCRDCEAERGDRLAAWEKAKGD